MLSIETRPAARKTQPLSDSIENYALFLSRLRYLTFKRSFYSIINAELSARDFQPGNKPSSSQDTIFLPYFFPVCDISTFNRSLHSILHPNRSARLSHRQYLPSSSQNAMFRQFWRKVGIIMFLLDVFRCVSALFTRFYTLNVEHAFSIVETGPGARTSQSFVDFNEK